MLGHERAPKFLQKPNDMPPVGVPLATFIIGHELGALAAKILYFSMDGIKVGRSTESPGLHLGINQSHPGPFQGPTMN